MSYLICLIQTKIETTSSGFTGGYKKYRFLVHILVMGLHMSTKIIQYCKGEHVFLIFFYVCSKLSAEYQYLFLNL